MLRKVSRVRSRSDTELEELNTKKVIQVEVAGFSPPQDQMGRKKAQILLTVEIRKQF